MISESGVVIGRSRSILKQILGPVDRQNAREPLLKLFHRRRAHPRRHLRPRRAKFGRKHPKQGISALKTEAYFRERRDRGDLAAFAAWLEATVRMPRRYREMNMKTFETLKAE